MNLYIQIENGAPINHPALEENIFQVYGLIPNYWELFTRIKKPVPTIYQILDSNTPTYAKVNGVWADVWPLRNMTAEEKATKQQAVCDEFNAREQASNWSTWTMDEATCTMIPPITRPSIDETKISQGIFTFWCGVDSNWKETPTRPEGEYKFDFIAWIWVAV
jgi:hypothetical protein